MTSLYITVSSQLGYDTARSVNAGVLTYATPSVYGSSSLYAVYDYGATDNSSASPYPIFTGDTDARAYFDSINATSLIASANAMMGSSYYTTYTINTVDAPVQADFSALARVATTGSYTDLINTPSIPAAQIQSDWNETNSLSLDYIKNKPSIPTVKAYDGTTLRSNAFPVFLSGTVSSGQVVLNITSDGTSGGTALFPTGPIMSSVNFIVSNSTAVFPGSWAWSNSNKTLTITLGQAAATGLISLLGLNLLGAPTTAANGTTVQVSVWGY